MIATDTNVSAALWLSTTASEVAERMLERDPEAEALRAESSGCILGHVARLPSRQRQAVLLHHFGGLSHREVASTLNVSEGNARVILHRGLAALRDSLGRECLLDFGDPISCERR